MTARGVIVHVKRAKQINDFSGLCYGAITPTDIDGLIEYRDKAYVVIETKYMDIELPHGQKLAIERLIGDISASGKPAIALVAEHHIHDTDACVPVAECPVREYYHTNTLKWQTPKTALTVREMTDLFLGEFM